jgi:hypothetical protein
VFTLGYVRAYAGALGLDEQLAVERYKREAPDGDKIAPLQPPAGVAFAEVRRHSPRVIAAVVALVIAVVGWNVFQRVSHMRSPPPAVISETPESWTLGAVPGQTQGLTEISLDVRRRRSARRRRQSARWTGTGCLQSARRRLWGRGRRLPGDAAGAAADDPRGPSV